MIKEQEAGEKTADVCRRHSISSATFYKYKSKYSGMEPSDAKRLRALEDENAKLKKLRCAEVLKAFGIDAAVDAYRPSRVDFAVDFLAPSFGVMPDNFVIHSRTGVKSYEKIEEIQVNGRSNRTTSVTVGKMPGRQAIVYDKREEVIEKRKREWPAIWGRAMNGPSAPPLDLSDSNLSRVWRVELRVRKRHLKEVWDINSWASLYELLPRIFEKVMEDIRYCEPCLDSNRS